MNIIATLLSLLISFPPPSSFTCDGEVLEAKIINNQNGDFSSVNDLDQIDAGAFVVINWKVKLMLPRTFIAGEKSFSDNKWKWIYNEDRTARLLEIKPSGQLYEHDCELKNV